MLKGATENAIKTREDIGGVRETGSNNSLIQSVMANCVCRWNNLHHPVVKGRRAREGSNQRTLKCVQWKGLIKVLKVSQWVQRVFPKIKHSIVKQVVFAETDGQQAKAKLEEQKDRLNKSISCHFARPLSLSPRTSSAWAIIVEKHFSVGMKHPTNWKQSAQTQLD